MGTYPPVPRLKRVDCSGPGIARRRHGRGFAYFGADGRRLRDREAIRRIESLAIPPAWTEVWVCPDRNGHLQATGIDAAGRKQYLYHPAWRERRDRAKFEDMIEFARALPDLRARVMEELEGSEPTREHVLACALRLLDLGFFRIGGEDYAERNDSYGLATLLKRHVRLGDGELRFDYIGKSGQHRVQWISDPDVFRIVSVLKRRRGGSPELLAYKRGGRWVDVKSEDINDHLKELIGGEFTAKSFRTWNATVLAAVALASPEIAPLTGSAGRRAVSAAVKTVAVYLGNTPAVCRSSYIDPRVIDRFEQGVTIAGSVSGAALEAGPADHDARGEIERGVLKLLCGEAELARAA